MNSKNVLRRLRSHASANLHSVSNIILNLRIQLKWFNDKSKLPLLESQKELYKTIHLLLNKQLNQFPDLVNCNGFNDRIQWLKLFDQDREIVRCSDKILVRDRVRERVGEKYLTMIYQVAQSFSELNIDRLPNSFVLKTNHDSGTVVVVRNKADLDLELAKVKLESSLKRAYGWLNGEWAYSYVEPRLLVEEFLGDNACQELPTDYKFYVVEGKVRFCHFIYDRNCAPKEQIVDVSGNDMRLELYPGFAYGTAFKKPVYWLEMISIAERVGSGFKCVRVDLYLIGERIIVGEMTFWPMAGHYKGKDQEKIGRLLDFDRSTFKPFLIPTLEAERSRHSLYAEGT